MLRPAECHFRAMGTDVHVIVVGDAQLVEVARARVGQLERRWSRFLPTSEVSRLNAAAGTPLAVSGDTVALVRACKTARAATQGRFDPTLHHAMIALGYDRDFALVRGAPARFGESGSIGPLLSGVTDIVLDEAAGTVCLPPDLGLDAGGLGKGLAADIVVAELIGLGADGAMVNLGGDLAASGEPPEAETWVIAIEDPHDTGRRLCRVSIAQGGVATSSILGRRWTIDGVEVHHLLDPSTGRPTTGQLVAATVVAGQAWWAEALTKSLLVGGPAVPLPAASALVVDAFGHAEILGDDDGAFVNLACSSVRS